MQSYNGVTVGRSLYETRTADVLRNEAVEKAKGADYVIFFGGLNKSDFQDCEGHDRKQYGLPYGQDELVEALLAVNKKLVFVNISGNAVAMPWMSRVPAIVQGWFLGSETGEALANVLLGVVNPSGKLPFTWSATLNDVPAHRLNAYLQEFGARSTTSSMKNTRKGFSSVIVEWISLRLSHSLRLVMV